MSSVPPDVLDRLRKIAGLLGSEHDGERAAAAAKASEILARYRITWADVVNGTAAGGAAYSTGAQQQRHSPPPPPPPPPEPEQDWADADPVIIPPQCPTEQFDNRVLRALAARAIEEDGRGLYDLGNTEFLQDVGPLHTWTPRQRVGLVRSLRRAWVIRKNAGLK